MPRDERGGWSWLAFVIGPLWYLTKGMFKKGILLLLLCVITFFMAAPFVWVYCAVCAKRDWYEYRMKRKSVIDLERL